MLHALYIRLPAHPDAPAQWYSPATPERREQAGEGELAHAARAALGLRHIVALMPSHEVLLTLTPMPTKQRQRLLKVVSYALEEQLVSDVETQHFALGAPTPAGKVAVAVVDKTRLQATLDLLAAAGIDPSVLTPEVLLVPWQPGTWSLLCNHSDAHIRTGMQCGLSVEIDHLTLVLEHALSQAGADKPRELQIYAPTDVPATLRDFAAHHELPLVHHTCEDALRLYAHHYQPSAALNLLQGDYSRREQWSRLWQPLRASAALAAAVLVLGLGLRVFEGFALAREEAHLKQAVEDLYRQTFPGEQRIVNPRAQMERHLAVLQGAAGRAGFLDLLAQTAPVLAQTPGTQLQNLRSQAGELEFDLTLKDLQALDQLKQRLAGQGGLSVDIVSASSQEGQVNGRLKIKAQKS